MNQPLSAAPLPVVGLTVTFAQPPQGADVDRMMKGGRLPAGWMTASTARLRVNHHLNVPVEKFGVKWPQ